MCVHVRVCECVCVHVCLCAEECVLGVSLYIVCGYTYFNSKDIGCTGLLFLPVAVISQADSV